MPEKKEETVWDLLTLTGMTLREAYARIDADLGPDAYKKLGGSGGGKELTDIKSPYVYECMAECFGPIGLGWGFDLREHEYLGVRHYKAKSGRDMTEHGASATVDCWYAIQSPEGPMAQTSYKVFIGTATGGAKNSERNYAESGAITNAIGKCLSFLGVQRHIYKESDPTVYESPEEEEQRERLSIRFQHMMDVLDTYETDEKKLEVGAALGNPSNRNKALEAFVALEESERVRIELLAVGAEEITK